MMNQRVFRGLVAVFAIAVIAAAFALTPIQDETYYWAWSQAPAWSYVDHPPGVAWILATSTLVFGTGVAALRIPALLAMALTALAAYAAARRLKDRDAGMLALLALFGAPMFAIGYLPATPDPFQGAAAALAAYAVVRAFEDRRGFWVFFAAFLLLASILLKHTSALLAAGAFLGALATAEGRALLKRKELWLGVALGALCLTPWLSSELATHGGSFAFQADRTLHRGSARPLTALPMLLGGLMIALGPVTAALLLYNGARAARARLVPAQVALFAGAFALIAACLVPVALGGGELNWTMPALAFAGPALAASLELRAKNFARVAGYVSTAILLVLLAHVVHPFLPIPAKKDTTRRGEAFVAVAQRARELAAQHGAKMIVTRRYQTASMMRFHLHDALPVLELGTARKSQYDAWPRPTPQPGDVVIVVLNEALPAELPLFVLADSEHVDPFTLTVAKIGQAPVARTDP